MFKPRHGLVSNETCIDPTGWTVDTGQLLDGTLRLAPIVTQYERTDTNMVEKTWDSEWEFENGDLTSWYTAGNYAVEDGKLRLHAEQFSWRDQTDPWTVSFGVATLLPAGIVGIDNSVGWSVEFNIACEGIVDFDIGDGTRVLSGSMGERNGHRGIWLLPPGALHSGNTGEFVFPLGDDFGTSESIRDRKSVV